MKFLLFKIIELLDKIIKKKNIIVFTSFPDYSDNSYALFNYMTKKKKYEKYELIWIVNSSVDTIKESLKREFNREFKVYKKLSFKGIQTYLMSKQVFSTHGIFGDIASGIEGKRINLWHGMPLKSIVLLDKTCSKNPYSQDYLIATSKIFQTLIKKAFNQNLEKVLLIGQPRNDLLFENTDFFDKFSLLRKSYNKVIMWMPTYRKSVIGDIRNDGEFSVNKISLLNINELKVLDKILIEKKNLLLIKLHPMDSLNTHNFDNFKNIIILKSNDLSKYDIQLYPLLGNCDVLITDYSSVYIDYEILEKPMLFAMDDFESYKNSRGFAINGEIEDYIPGKIITSSKEFLKSFEIGEYNYLPCKKELNKFKDNKNSKRLLEALKIN